MGLPPGPSLMAPGLGSAEEPRDRADPRIRIQATGPALPSLAAARDHVRGDCMVAGGRGASRRRDYATGARPGVLTSMGVVMR